MGGSFTFEGLSQFSRFAGRSWRTRWARSSCRWGSSPSSFSAGPSAGRSGIVNPRAGSDVQLMCDVCVTCVCVCVWCVCVCVDALVLGRLPKRHQQNPRLSTEPSDLGFNQIGLFAVLAESLISCESRALDRDPRGALGFEPKGRQPVLQEL